MHDSQGKYLLDSRKFPGQIILRSSEVVVELRCTGIKLKQAMCDGQSHMRGGEGGEAAGLLSRSENNLVEEERTRKREGTRTKI
jgi:hypothetical protein